MGQLILTIGDIIEKIEEIKNLEEQKASVSSEYPSRSQFKNSMDFYNAQDRRDSEIDELSSQIEAIKSTPVLCL